MTRRTVTICFCCDSIFAITVPMNTERRIKQSRMTGTRNTNMNPYVRTPIVTNEALAGFFSTRSISLRIVVTQPGCPSWLARVGWRRHIKKGQEKFSWPSLLLALPA
ncbi:hypothetical protein SBA5_80084 [Candidatus Sulfotelmatomonas gaucii]|uniref:Uncharacterized protein n=1 Tax=Candidatus Sulfuritelmatomonas gaucii TaxID=2043161 RepID=A0A2N9M5L0_9BACT|nr:hypothetical protein SBA5_80084 [Candidatus Sulfotelmatomonas gaucii]